MTSRVTHLGEVALRVNDLDATRAFYRDLVRLGPWREGDGYVFFRIADAVESHPQALVRLLRPERVTTLTA